MNERIIIPKKVKIFDYIFVVFGFIILSISLFIFIKGLVYHVGGERIEAEVKSIIEDDENREIWIKYNYNNIEYENLLDHWNAELDIGDEVMIYCLKNNPNKFVSESDYIFSFVLLFIVGGGMFAYFFIQLYKYKKEYNRVKKILEKGEKIEGQIISVEEISKNIMFGETPWIIVAISKNREEPFVSKFVWINANISGYVDKCVDIYLYDNDYYIDYISVR